MLPASSERVRARNVQILLFGSKFGIYNPGRQPAGAGGRRRWNSWVIHSVLWILPCLKGGSIPAQVAPFHQSSGILFWLWASPLRSFSQSQVQVLRPILPRPVENQTSSSSNQQDRARQRRLR